MIHGLSYANGTSKEPLLGMTIPEKFDMACEQYADHEALVSCQQNVRLTYRQLQAKVNAFACSLLKMGLKKGDRIGIWSPNCVEWTITQFAASKAGIILVNLNTAYKSNELEYVLNKVSCAALVIAPAFKTTNYQEIITKIAPEITNCSDKLLNAARLPHLKHVIKIEDQAHTGLHKFDDLLIEPSHKELEDLQAIADDLQFDETINIQFTSGTTGNPKGTMLTHNNILNNGFFVGEAIRLTEKDRVCISVPLFHCFGMVMGNLACITHGATMVYPAGVFNPLESLKAMQNEKCTASYGVPTMFIGMLEHEQFDQFDLSSLRTGIMAGSPCPREIMQRVIDRMNMSEITICYGMTETSPVSVQSSTTDSIEQRVSTVGRIHPHLEIKIIDEHDKIVPKGKLGELCVRGYSVMLGYWEEPEKTKEVIDEAGWMHTGDIAEMDADGFVKIKGRIKDVVIRGGENLFPKEIEDFLYTHPDISDVQVIGLPDAKYGEELCACIILHEHHQTTEDTIKLYCKEHISHNKVPKYVRFFTEFPLTASGKAQKFKLQEFMRTELKLTDIFS
ncbi:AMP-binding protein [Acinetobacter gerneri]|uniref:AMP-binding protein n=1 Tax=Acinetobacter gerneri TaxID=202952 RepID=A0AAW8JR22_9GAMM|nr:AMP-binding protein [Acinetobacter gerneri]MDQ9010805.1 AMP-binding protein [Acinetobacter gerneri]MDQ9014941.1 AMP-binding protein [Acinetobacter gerneri]MDQ9026126.1 AMP-binding protein [Acinetobacter gerneri]MDQ9053407.1 AMP-binding protein [Acinetobacter gerneri]MDQ9061012.1 AMP-binding protein [Acinetobacter gerneri]